MKDTTRTPTSPASNAADVSQTASYQRFLRNALALGTESANRSKWARRKMLLGILAPIDALTRTGPWKRAGALTLAGTPLIVAAPFVYSRFGFNALIFKGLLPVSLLIALLFALAKSLQHSKWRPLDEHPDDLAEVERILAQREDARQLKEAILLSGRTLRGADLTLLTAYNKKRDVETRNKLRNSRARI
jgi:hypothetical protein